jgi:hypothetical protein
LAARAAVVDQRRVVPGPAVNQPVALLAKPAVEPVAKQQAQAETLVVQAARLQVRADLQVRAAVLVPQAMAL